MTHTPPTPTIDRMLEETRSLLEDARTMVAAIDPMLDTLPAAQRLMVVREISRLTGRLTAVLSWLLARKAVATEEYADDDPRAEQGLFGVGDARIDPQLGEAVPDWAVPFADLLEGSADLFARAARLDRVVRRRWRIRSGRPSTP